ncbi:TPA: prolyl oligopeptidase family serine peptidase [Streptococcus equi subsp. zooepidemicus]|nr:prolyl oligopeptidase family serine peptidase [Streptococcus equi subsp. zooepidemicus]HEL0074530.1 prolyl oligopeptidase family serine peptidase [Streptococcus equi subsp. zooepidemicus]HEL0088321.1 prolyl oligopeptidase family serine peptidase [Streptococcus equi subsp. zooepidemicus]HEL0222696.1 prolyl oligopeptidase family serine peptidase [Streptococcus equi subsp. zooepidemicus]HEL0250374.1 prolyl oligopeptidase family serine peptidase [Streptococcus equi subsp. zooepidemicus]
MIDRNTEFLNIISSREEYKNIIFDSLNFLVDSNSYIFRRGKHWYRLENWDLPDSGVIREWQADEEDFIPKDEYTEKINIHNSKIIFDVQILNKQGKLGDIRQITFTDDCAVIMAIVELQHNFNIVLFDKKSLEIINMIKNISVETLPYLTKNGVLFCRNDNLGRPNQLCYKLIRGAEEHLLYREEEISYRLRIIPSRDIDGVCLIKSANFQQGKVFFYDERSNESKLNIVIDDKKESHLPNYCNLIEILDEIYLVTSFRNRNSIGVCLKKIDSSEQFWIKINNSTVIKGVEIFGSNILLKLSSESCYSYLLLKHQKSKKLNFKEILIKFNNDTIVYENCYSNNYIIFLERSIFSENVLSFDINTENLQVKFSKSFWENEDIKSKLIWTSCDENGIKIPISLLWKGKEELPYKKKCILYVYGAYGKDDSVKLDPTILSIIKSNFLYAVVHVRGGGFLGGEWYRSGKGLKKKNSITDFIKGVNYLIENDIVDSSSIGLISSSAGAIVAGAAFNDNPYLFKSILLFSPFIDPYSSLLSKKDPLSKTELGEWGDISNKEIQDYIKGYSPMQNIGNLKQSNTTIISLLGENDIYIDNRSVIEWSNKLCMKNIKSLVYINKNAGHGGVSHKDKDLFVNILSYFLSVVSR